MSTIKYLYETSLLETDVQVIVHQCYCNSKRKSIKGLTKDIFTKYPYSNVYNERKSDSKPGSIEIRGSLKNKERWVCAIFTQYNPGDPDKYDTEIERKEWFKKSLQSIIKTLKNLKSIAFPYKIGGGDWNSYEKMLIDFAAQNPNVAVYILSQDPEPPKKYDYTLEFLENLIKKIKRDEKDGIDKIELEKEHDLYIDRIKNPPEIETLSLDEYTWEKSTLDDFTRANIPTGWEEFFNKELESSIYNLSKYLSYESVRNEIYPELNMVYNAFMVKPSEIKVLLCGQDPYHDVGQAMGLSFSVKKEIIPPPSLKNIYKELLKEGFTIKNQNCGSLLKWAKQGVFLLNTSLTVRAHEPKSHSKKWLESFTPSLMKWLDEHCNDLVLLLWGLPAQNIGKYFGERHKKVICAHPSPLSAYKGFLGSNCFLSVNEQLKSMGKETIDWSL